MNAAKAPSGVVKEGDDVVTRNPSVTMGPVGLDFQEEARQQPGRMGRLLRPAGRNLPQLEQVWPEGGAIMADRRLIAVAVAQGAGITFAGLLLGRGGGGTDHHCDVRPTADGDDRRVLLEQGSGRAGRFRPGRHRGADRPDPGRRSVADADLLAPMCLSVAGAALGFRPAARRTDP